jgi:hypothetical protein
MTELSEIRKHKAKFHRLYNQIIQSDEFGFDKKLKGADVEVVLGSILNKQPIPKIASILKRKYKLSEGEATRVIRKVITKFEKMYEKLERGY